jgi:HPt (histidine-containing phosphotransfer) domain-containing protein
MIKLLDWKRALENTDGSEELLLELARVFVATYSRMLQEIRTAIDANDAVTLHRAAHNLKGSAQIFAAGAVVEQALHLEEMGAAADLSGADDKYADLERQVAELRAALSERLERTGAGERKSM